MVCFTYRYTSSRWIVSIVYYPMLYIISLHVGWAFGLHRSNCDSDQLQGGVMVLH